MLVQRNVVDGYDVVGVSPSGCPSISEDNDDLPGAIRPQISDPADVPSDAGRRRSGHHSGYVLNLTLGIGA